MISTSEFGSGGSGISDVVIGGGQSDTISTFVGADVVEGRGGNDTIYGGDGFETAVFSGTLSDHTITEDNANGLLLVTDLRGIDGTDTLRSFNRLQFADQSVDYPVPGILLIGTEAADTLAGGEGTDSLDGAGG